MSNVLVLIRLQHQVLANQMNVLNTLNSYLLNIDLLIEPHGVSFLLFNSNTGYNDALILSR